MKVLVACEESQVVCKAFRDRGHEAYSCDIQDCSGGHPEWHIKRDVLEILYGMICFKTQDGSTHAVTIWDLVIAHPPCTYLAASSAVRLFTPDHCIKDQERFEKGKKAKAFFMEFYNAPSLKIAIENPCPLKIFGLTPFDQIIEPFYFGEDYRKRTCLWLKGLPPLFSTEITIPRGLWVGSSSKRDSAYELHSNRNQKRRSRTFEGIGRAMAEQWG